MPVVDEVPITSIEQLVATVRETGSEWNTKCPWFRGEPGGVATPLLPGLYRCDHDENQLLQQFRMKGPSFVPPPVPRREDTDEWLFLAQHFGVPTRLLDWTEGALLGLYFALKEYQPDRDEPILWMLNPTDLNRKMADDVVDCTFPLTWFSPTARINIGETNVRAAWELDKKEISTHLPVAVQPSYIHPRISAQQSCFTVHGWRKESLNDFEEVGPECLKKYRISFPSGEEGIAELRRLGISHSRIFPDAWGLGQELKSLY